MKCSICGELVHDEESELCPRCSKLVQKKARNKYLAKVALTFGKAAAFVILAVTSVFPTPNVQPNPQQRFPSAYVQQAPTSYNMLNRRMITQKAIQIEIAPTDKSTFVATIDNLTSLSLPTAYVAHTDDKKAVKEIYYTNAGVIIELKEEVTIELHYENLDRQDSSLIITAIGYFGNTVLPNVALSLFSSFLYDWLKEKLKERKRKGKFRNHKLKINGAQADLTSEEAFEKWLYNTIMMERKEPENNQIKKVD